MEETKNELQELEIGDEVTGTIVKVEEKQVLVDIGYKSEAIVPISELSNLQIEKPSDVVSEGEEVTLKVIKFDENDEVICSRKAVIAEKAWVDLEEKMEANEIFETEVKEIVKGGLVVDVGLRGFIPASLVENYFVEDFSDYLNKKLSVKVVELDREQNRVILSHRAVKEEEEEKERKQLLESLQKGQVIEGTVQRLTDFGAFVDIGGVDGLVHISELAHEHVEKASDVVSEGDKIEVEVLSVDVDAERISLSRKNTLPGPWSGIEEKVSQGDVLEGTVKRLVSFGAFVELFPGVEGLVHISEIANRHIGTPGEVLEEEQKVEVKVLSVDADEQRISLSIKQLQEDAQKEEIRRYEMTEESGFQLGDMIGDQLKKFKK